jgi:hypothetical protein
MNSYLLLLTLEALVTLVIKINYYLSAGWFSKPTPFGILVLLILCIFTAVPAFFVIFPDTFTAISKFFQKIDNMRKLIPWLSILAMGLITLIIFPQILPKVVFSYLDNQFDVIILFFLIIIQTLILISRDISSKFTRITDLLLNFCSRFYILILFLGLVIGKFILLASNAYVLIAPADGYQYWMMAKQLFSHSLDILSFHHYPPLYSLSISPVFAESTRDSLQNISLINILISSSTLFPIYLLSRIFLSRSQSNLLVLASAINPFQFVYPIFPSSENLYYPLFFWTVYFLISQPKQEKHCLIWDILTGLSIGLSWLTRYQTVVLLPIFLIIWWIKPTGISDGIEIRWTKTKIIHSLVLISVILLCLSFWVIPGLLSGVPFKEMLGFQIEGDVINSSKTFPMLLLWIFVSIAYFCLVAGPVFFTLLSTLFTYKSYKWSPLIIRWIISVLLLAIAFLVTISRHAWLANYNDTEPTRLIGRYVIYLTIILWLTGMILSNTENRTNPKFLILPFILSICLLLISYQVFCNPTWIFTNDAILFLHVDGYTPMFLGWVFFFTIAVCSIGIIIFTKKRFGNLNFYLIFFCILVLNLLSLPDYFDNIMSLENSGRFINEIVDKIINSPDHNYEKGSDVQVYIPETIKHYKEQFEVKGIDTSRYSFNILEKYPPNTQKCEPLLVINISNFEKYGIMSSSRGCKITNKQELISTFSFNNHEYFLASLPQ